MYYRNDDVLCDPYVVSKDTRYYSMNHDFIARAEKLTSFNITTKDLQTLDFKNEVRHLFEKHYFSDVKITGVNQVDMDNINTTISHLKQVDSQNFYNMHNYSLKGIGPSEMSLYCIVDSATLGGGSSAGTDLFTDCGQYEIKAASISKDNVASNFLLGNGVFLGDLIHQIDDLAVELELNGGPTEISKSNINDIRLKAPTEFSIIENTYAERAAAYFGNHKTIFVHHAQKNTPNVGYVASIKQVTFEDIQIERITKGTIKPMVKL